MKEKLNKILNKHVSQEDGIINLYNDSRLDVVTAMIEFANVACKAQKKICSEEAKTIMYDYSDDKILDVLADLTLNENEVGLIVDKQGILNSPTVKFD